MYLRTAKWQRYKLKMITKQQTKSIIEKLKPYYPSRVGIFGSYARNTQTPESDLDIIVNLRKPINLLEFIKLEAELSRLLKVKVDLVTEKSINKHLESSIQKDIIYILNE